jgi:hypothetical protein
MMYDGLEAFTVNIPLKIFICFLLSAFVLVGMTFYFYESVVNEPVELSMLVAVFLTLFLFFFFCFNMRQTPVEKPGTLAVLVEEEPVIQDYIPELSSLSNHEVGFSSLELVDEDLGETVRFIHGAEPIEPTESAIPPLVSMEAVDDAAELEDISSGFGANSIIIFKQPFAYSLSNPELLHGAASQVIYEQNGIHYINNNLNDDGMDKTWDSDFAKLVESVLSPSAL